MKRHSVKVLLAIAVCVFCARGRAAEGQEPDLRYEDVVRLITDNHLQKIEDLLPRLPESYRSGYTLMQNSVSTQDASQVLPRAILFGRDGRLLMAFNGDSSQNGFDTLEMIQFRDETQSFEMRVIEFPGSQSDIREPKFSEANPPVCLQCHGQNPRPNWETYSIWKGAYGEVDDTVDQTEFDAYVSFKQSQSQHPRYKWLLASAKSPMSPYRPGPFNFDRNDRANLKLTKFIVRLNAKRLAGIVSRQATPVLQADIERNLVGCTDDNSLAKDLSALGLSARAWSTAFRAADSDPALSSYRFPEGSIDLKDLVAASLLESWMKSGDKDAANFYKLDTHLVSGDRGDLDDVINAMGSPLDLSNTFKPLCQLLAKRAVLPDGAEYQSARQGESQITLTTKPGAFGIPWHAAEHLERQPAAQ